MLTFPTDKITSGSGYVCDSETVGTALLAFHDTLDLENTKMTFFVWLEWNQD